MTLDRKYNNIFADLEPVGFYSGLTFNNHVKAICKKASQKLIAIIRMANILSEYKRKLFIKTFFESQFNYFPLIWMFCDRSANQKINKLHERALRIAYDDYNSSFEELGWTRMEPSRYTNVILERWLLKCIRYLMGYRLHL